MEGILGALYVSDNCTLEGAEKFFETAFKPFFDEFVTLEMLARHAADAVLEMLNRLGCRQYSRVHNVVNGVHSCKSESVVSRFHRILLKCSSRLAWEHTLRGQGCKFGRGGAKSERKMPADADGEAKILEGRVQLLDHSAEWGNQARPEEKINLFVCLSVGENASLFLGPGSGIRLCRGIHHAYGVWGIAYSW